MTKNNYTEIFGRSALLLILAFSLVLIGSLSALAEIKCPPPCDDAVQFENHVLEEGKDPSTCESPIADFCAYPREGCDSLEVFFTDYSRGYIDTWIWDFGDPASGAANTSNEENPSHMYRSTGRYTVTLTIIGCGGTDMIKKKQYVTIHKSPKADFTSSTRIACEGTSIDFFDNSIEPEFWHWTFGDGSESFVQNPSHTYTTAGTYTVTLVVLNKCGEDRRIKYQYITIEKPPIADFTADQTDLCEGAVVQFTDASQFATGWLWDFGDGTTSIDKNPGHSYTQPGTYDVTLTVSNSCGTDKMLKQQFITVRPKPIADFSYKLNGDCEGANVTFNDLSQYTLTWHWDFGDGTTSPLQNPGSHAYPNAGTYTVTLTVTNDCGNDITSEIIEVEESYGPTADFTADPREACIGAAVQFTDLSSYPDTWYWDFGDGSTSYQQHPSHSYQAEGLYTVSLMVTNECGEDTETKREYILVKPLPTADFTVQTTEYCLGETVNFINLSTNELDWLWDFGDGTTSILENPTHIYTTAGIFTISLTVTNECGDDKEIKLEYIKVDYSPIADFDAQTHSGCEGGTVTLANTSVNARTYLWDFGDGTTSPLANPISHNYNAPGLYTIRLTVSNFCGTDFIEKTVEVEGGGGPIADFTSDKQLICEGETVLFTDLSIRAETWSWNFGDGSSTSHEKNPTHTYTSAGKYPVILSVTNECGVDIAIKTEYITVSPLPIADFDDEPFEACKGTEVAFFDLSQNADTWLWDFGEGTTSPLQNPIHVYTTAGLYSTSLTVTNSCGTDTKKRILNVVIISEPIAQFIAENTEGCTSTSIKFTDQSQWAQSWYWEFGDGATSTLRYPSHTYLLPGLYNVTLTVSNICGEDSETKTEYIRIIEGPDADFNANPKSGFAPLLVSFEDLSTSPTTITKWAWTFGDGGTSDMQDPNHTYTTAGTYTVSLTVTDDCGNDTETKEEYIIVDNTCTVDFNAEVPQGCESIEVYFFGFASQNCEITSWTWDFGDPASGANNSATGQNASHLYSSPGSYTVTLTAVDVSGVKVVVKDDFVHVFNGPTAAFDANPTSGAVSLLVSFTNQSTSDFIDPSFNWNFGDPNSGSLNISTEIDPTHLYQTEGNYTATLIISDECGFDTTSMVISVSPPVPPLVLLKTVDRANALPGQELLYELTLRNDSNETITNITINDTIPDHTTFVLGSITGAIGSHSISTGNIRWSIASIQPDEEIVMSFRVLINLDITSFPTIISNQGNGIIKEEPMATASNAFDVFLSNIVITEVGPQLNELIVTKEVSKTLASPNDQLRYTITVRNNEPTIALDVMIYDAIPDTTAYVAGSIFGSGAYNPTNDSLIWNIGNLDPFESVVVGFDVTVFPNCEDGAVIPNTAAVSDRFSGSESNEVVTVISHTPLVIRKTSSAPSGMLGDLIKFAITIDNFSNSLFTDVELLDTMPAGFFYIDGTSTKNGGAISDPTGNNPYSWQLGDLPGGGTIVLEYTCLISTSAATGMHENVAIVEANQGGNIVRSNRAIVDVYVLSYTLHGMIRGKVIVDCDGDGIADSDEAPVGMDIFLDDGSHSQVNNKGMFYFSTVRAGERVVALDERDMDGYFVPDGAEKSVFAHVHETGESYIIFSVCPEYPLLDISKAASIIPTVLVTKLAELNPNQPIDSFGVLIDYEIEIKSNGLADPTTIRVVDSFPENTRLSLSESEEIKPAKKGNQLVYELTAAKEKLQKSVYYSLRDLKPGLRQFLNNKVHLEGDLAARGDRMMPAVSEPIEVSAGPFLLSPPVDVMITLTPALFITSMADLQAPAFPQLEAVADSIAKYADAIIRVEGHTDYRPINTKKFPSNWELGEARAKAVVNWLADNKGFDRDRLKYESFAATRPVVTVGKTSEELQPNRRTEVIIQAAIGGFVDPAAIPKERWQNSTSMALDPVRFDSLFEAPPTDIDFTIEDSWEVVLRIRNTSEVEAENALFSDIMPSGVVYIEGSALLDGIAVTPTISANTLSLTLAKILPEQTMELRYRVKAAEGMTPGGGGSASVSIQTKADKTVVQKSNEVRFK